MVKYTQAHVRTCTLPLASTTARSPAWCCPPKIYFISGEIKMLKVYSFPLYPAESSSADVRVSNTLPSGTYTGELVASRNFDSKIDCIYVLTDGKGADFLVSSLASKEDVGEVLGRLYGLDIPLSCLNDLIGVPVTIKVAYSSNNPCIEPCKPLSGTVRCDN